MLQELPMILAWAESLSKRNMLELVTELYSEMIVEAADSRSDDQGNLGVDTSQKGFFVRPGIFSICLGEVIAVSMNC